MRKRNYTIRFDDEAFKIMTNASYGNRLYELLETFKTLITIFEEVPAPLLQLNSSGPNPRFLVKFKGSKKIFYVTAINAKNNAERIEDDV